MPHLINAYRPTNQIGIADNERKLLQNLKNSLTSKGVFIEPLFVENFYVALKSFSSLLLVGPLQTGKLTMLDRIGELLTDTPAQHFQKMVGHAYWASGSHNVALFVDAQNQQNMHNLLNFLEEASQPENAKRLFIACMSRISPAEIDSIFSLPGFRLFQNLDLIPYPPNFRLIGTMDASRFHWWSSELLLQTAILHWPINKPNHLLKMPPSHSRLQETNTFFIQTCIRDERVAYSRLLDLLGDRQSFAPFMTVVNVLQNHNIDLPREAINQAIVFGVNAWTQDDNGIFSESISKNLTLALDMALAQYILPWITIAESDKALIYRQLKQLLIRHGFKQSILFLNKI